MDDCQDFGYKLALHVTIVTALQSLHVARYDRYRIQYKSIFTHFHIFTFPHHFVTRYTLHVTDVTRIQLSVLRRGVAADQ